MHTLHWKDLEHPGDGPWEGLALHVHDALPQVPSMHLQSGPNGRVRFVANGQVLFWATISEDHSGVWLIRTMADLPLEAMPIAPIDSAQVEHCKPLRGDAWFKAWARFFASQLRERSGSFLHDGLWLMRGARALPAPHAVHDGGEAMHRDVQQWRYRMLGDTNSRLPRWHFDGFAEVLQTAPVHWLDWMLCGNDGLVALRRTDDSDGRIKWWRKKAREGALPPILALHLGCLDACIIVDGHCRLRAALLENVPPDIVTIACTREFQVEHDPAIQARVVHSLYEARQRRGTKALSVERLNEILIQAFDDRPILSPATHARARLTEAQWAEEVSGHLRGIGQTADLDQILARH